MSTLSYNIDAAVNLTNMNVSVNADQNDVPSGTYDVAFIAYADFLNGNYRQDSSDINDLVSNVTYSSANVNNAFTFYVSEINELNFLIL